MLQALRFLLPASLGFPSAAEATRTGENGRMVRQPIRFVRIGFRTIALHILVFVSMFVTGAVQATTFLPVQGGPGGGNFTRECSGDFIVGIYVRSGDWVDAIGLKCGIFNQTQGEFNQPPWNTPYFGGGGGADQERVCAKDRFVSAIRFNVTGEASHPFVNFIELTCTPIGGGASNTLCIQTGQGCPAAGAIVQTCPAGDPAARGIRGRTGLYVDALGLICGPKPATIPPVAVHERPEACPRGDEAPDEWSEMLNAHNERRRQHCVPPLAWSNALQKEAQAYANQCMTDQHGIPVGENLAAKAKWVDSTPVLPALTDRDAFEQAWYCEAKDNYDFDNPEIKPGFHDERCLEVNAHFTQIVWKDTCELGCGRATCTIKDAQGTPHQGTFWVCRYSPPGNVNDATVLKQQVFRRQCP